MKLTFAFIKSKINNEAQKIFFNVWDLLRTSLESAPRLVHNEVYLIRRLRPEMFGMYFKKKNWAIDFTVVIIAAM